LRRGRFILRGALAPLKHPSSSLFKRNLLFGGFTLQDFLAYYSRIQESLREAKPPLDNQFPLSKIGRYSLCMRGIKGVRLTVNSAIMNLFRIN